MFRNILLDIPKRWLGGPKPRTGSLPRPVEHAFRRGFPAPVGRLFLHVRAEKKNDRRVVFGISQTPPHGHFLIDSIIRSAYNKI